MKMKDVFDSSVYPKDGERVLYYFEPFERWYVGKFSADKGTDIFGPMISGEAGFSTWHPEVTMWMKGEKDE